MLNWSSTYALLLMNQLSERWYTLHILLRCFWRCRAFKNLESLEKRFKTDVLSAFVRAHATQKSSTHDDRKQADLRDSRFQRPHPQQPGYGRQDQFVMLCVTYFLQLSGVVNVILLSVWCISAAVMDQCCWVSLRLWLYVLNKILSLWNKILWAQKNFVLITRSLLVGRQEGHPACKSWVVRYWRGYLSGARCKLFASGPADVTDTLSSLAPVKSIMVYRYLSGAGLPRLSWKKGHEMDVVVLVAITRSETKLNQA